MQVPGRNSLLEFSSTIVSLMTEKVFIVITEANQKSFTVLNISWFAVETYRHIHLHFRWPKEQHALV